MNKSLHRIVFNARRGQPMAVADTARTHGGAGDCACDLPPRAVTLGVLTVTLSLIAFGALVLCAPAGAQIRADAGAPGAQRPTVLRAANGVTQVNIQTPSAAGVSRNVYCQFDVGAGGVILNNSSANVGTRLAGMIAGNPWIGAAPARVILNEVNSSDPSYLRGPLEVAGQRAEVVIANPSGIQVSGGSFINAAGVTLTTGAPVMNGGSLESFRVQKGRVNIEGLGLEAGTADATRILARAIEVNAGLWAKHLTVVAGSNAVKALVSGAAATATPIAGSGPAPAFMLDVAAIGGMYAGHIYLRGTEAGLGVNNRGALASQGDLVLLADGRLVNAGTVQAQGALELQAKAGIVNDGANARIAAVGGATLRTQADVTNSGGARVAVQGPLRIDAARLDNTASSIGSGAALDLHADDIANSAGGQIASVGPLTIDASRVVNAAAGLQSLDDIVVRTRALDNTAGRIVSDRGVRITGDGTLSNAGGTVSAGTVLKLESPSAARTLGIGNAGGTLAAGEQLRLDADRLAGAGKLLSAGSAVVNLTQDLRNEGEIIANGDLDLNVTGALTNQHVLKAGGALTVQAGDIHNAVDAEISADRTGLQARGELVNRGLIDGRATRLQAQRIHNAGGGRIYGDQLALQAFDLVNDASAEPGAAVEAGRPAATIAARQRLDLGVQRLDNRDGALILSAGDLAIGGALDAQGHATGAAQTVSNRSATIESLGDLRLDTRELVNIDDHLTWRVDAVPVPGSQTGYYTPAGYVDASEVGWHAFLVGGAFFGRSGLVLRTHEFGDPVYAAYARTPAYTPATVVRYPSGDDYREVVVPDQFGYERDSPVWALFGVTPPTGPSPGARPTTQWVPEGESGRYVEPTSEELQAWDRAVAPWLELQSRLEAFWRSVASAALSYDAYRTYTETRSKPVVVTSQPARLASGANMTLRVGDTALNQDSAIIAGAALTVQGGQVTNRATEVSAPTTRSGTFYNWGVLHQSCDFFGCDPVYGWRSAPYQETIARTAALATVRYEQRATVAASAQPAAQVGAPPPNTVRTLEPGTVPAATSLFRRAPDAQARYVFETDPRFTDAARWLGSDYMLNLVGADPAAVQKRLGDGFYEQRLVREQVAQLTGRRFLDGHASDEAQYRALMTEGATVARQWSLVPGVALSPEQTARLTSDIVWLVAREVVLPDGSRQTALVPQLYVRARPGDLDASGALLSGREVQLDLAGDLANSGTIAGRTLVRVEAQNLRNLAGTIAGDAVELLARDDLSNVGGTLSADRSLKAHAGGDLTVASTTARGSGSAGVGRYSSEQIDRVARVYVGGPGGALTLSAGGDLGLAAAQIDAGQAQLQAGQSIRLQTLETRSDMDATWNARNYARIGQSAEVGTEIRTTGALALAAGQDVAVRAATLQAGTELSVHAGRDLRIEEGRQTLDVSTASYAKGRGVVSGRSTEARQQRSQDNALGSRIGGGSVVLEAGGDLSVRGSAVIGDRGATLTAGNVDIGAAVNHARASEFNRDTITGVFSSGGVGVTVGRKEQETRQASHGTTAAASTVGAVAGDVAITAAQRYAQTGSDVLAPGGDVTIAARDVRITEAREASTTTTEQRFKQSGLTVQITSPVISAVQTVQTVQTVQSMAQAAGDTGDARMKALAAANVTFAANDAAKAIRAGQGVDALGKSGQIPTRVDESTGKVLDSRDATSVDRMGGVDLAIGLGSSRSSNATTQTRDTARGSTVAASGDVTIAAAGGGAESHVVIRGSEVTAGRDATVAAEGDIELQAAQNTASLAGRSSSRSASVGVTVGTSGFGITASASAGQGREAGSDLTHTATHVVAGDTARLTSGRDATLQGAVVQAQSVQVQVGRDLAISSLQDASTYDSRSKNVGVSVTLGPRPSGSLTAGKSNAASNFESVVEPAGISAGDRGFQVEVQGHTALLGGVVSSTDAAVADGRNRLSTGTLASADLHNRAEASASSSGIHLSTDMLSQGKYGAAKAAIGGLLNQASEASSSAGDTRSAVSAGVVTITDDAAQRTLTGQTAEEAVAALNRVTATAHVAAQKQDVQSMQQRVEAEREIRQELIRAVSMLTDEAYRSRMQRVPQLFRVECPAGADCGKNPELLVRTAVTKEEIAQAKAESIIAVNGIFNDEKRAAELAYQNTQPLLNLQTNKLDKPKTVYLMHIEPAANAMSELLGVAYEKITASADYGLANFLGYTNAQTLYADLLRSRGQGSTTSLAHSRGTLIQEGAFVILADQKDAQSQAYTNPNLTVRGVGGAADAKVYSNKAAAVLGKEGDRSQITFNYFSNDPVATSSLSGGNPGVWTLSDLWQVYKTSNSMHSCYGTGAPGCTQVEIPMPGGAQGTPEGNAKLIEFVGGVRKAPLPVPNPEGRSP